MQTILSGHAALGTAWWLEASLPEEHNRLPTLTKKIIALITDYEKRYSRFRNDSLVTRLNTERHLENPDPELIAILTYGKKLYERTEGLFNLLVGEIMEARGYDAHYRFTPKDEPATPPNPFSVLIINENEIRLDAGRIDLGGFGKGYLIDLLAEQLRGEGIQEFLINGGGDIYASHEDNNPMPIYLEHPTEAHTYLGTTPLKHAGFAASSPFKRRWNHNGKEYTHIVGNNTDQLATFVTAKTARDADAFATAAMFWSKDELLTKADKEGIGVARFNPTTNEFTSHNFLFEPI